MAASPSSSNSADIAQLRHMAFEFTEGFNSGDVDRLMRFYGERYVDVNLRSPVQTKEERRAYYLEVMKRGIRVKVQPDEIVVEGERAFIRGTIQITAASGQQSELRYLEVARKTRDGNWVAEWGMDGPVQEYTPG